MQLRFVQRDALCRELAGCSQALWVVAPRLTSGDMKLVAELSRVSVGAHAL